MKKRVIFMTSLLSISLFLAGCGEKKESSVAEKENKLTVYTTVYPLKYFTEEIGGKFVQVETIYPPGADEHTFEPTQKDMMKLADSDLFIYIGLGLEGFVEKAESTLKNEDVTLLPAGEKIHFEENDELGEDAHQEEETEHVEEGELEHHQGDIDPHVWLNPSYASELALAIKDALVKQLPEQKELFEENYASIDQELKNLDKNFENVISSSKNKEIIVSHAAYGYWEKRYEIEQISVSGISSTNEPTQKQLENIISTAKEHDLKYIFFEQNINSKLAEIVQEEMNGTSLVLHNLSVLTEKDIKEERTYFSIMEDNLKALEKALN